MTHSTRFNKLKSKHTGNKLIQHRSSRSGLGKQKIRVQRYEPIFSRREIVWGAAAVVSFLGALKLWVSGRGTPTEAK